ncbi:basic proline-rich protein-like [Schistocerca serialis cubense]|uniref:basic proline-rich protein-like n=1 Tax=Schistocerca serialis cubense TaxID=2023355 RepID=UPI00214E9889|nr:basic proline-rich protein-like [Schistocerca serialis cubense]
MAHPPLAPPQRARLPSSPLPVRSPAPDGRLSPPPWPNLRSPPWLPPPWPPPYSSAVPNLIGAEAVVTPPPSPMEVVTPPPHLSTPSGGVRPEQVFHGAFFSPPREQL